MATRETQLSALFSGKKAKWLPLYRRLLARILKIPSIDVVAQSRHLSLTYSGTAFGLIRATPLGIEMGFALDRAAIKSSRLKVSKTAPKKITHRLTVCEAAEIDDELISWVRASCQQARIAKRRST